MKNKKWIVFGILTAILAGIILVGGIYLHNINRSQTELPEKDQTIIEQNVRVVTDGVPDDQTYSFTAEGWLQYLMELPGNRCVSSIDMNMFDYALTEDIQWPEELTAYLDSGNEMMRTCTTTYVSDEYDSVFFGRKDGLLLMYKQHSDRQAGNYVSILIICDKEAEKRIEFDIAGVSGAKKVYCNDYCKGIGRELLVFTFDGKLYAVNEAMEIYEVSCRTS